MKPWQPYLFTFLLSLAGVLAVASMFGWVRSQRESRKQESTLTEVQKELDEAVQDARDAKEEQDSQSEQQKRDNEALESANQFSRETRVIAEEQLADGWEPSPGTPPEQAKEAVKALVARHDERLAEIGNLQQRNGRLESEYRDLSQKLASAASAVQSPAFRVVKYPFSNEGTPRENAALYLVWTNEARLALVAQTDKGTLVGLHAGATLESPMDRVRSDFRTYQTWCEDFEPRSASDSVATSPNQAEPASEFQIQMKVTGKSQRFDVLPLDQWPDSPGEHLAELLQLLMDGDDQVEALRTGSGSADGEDRGAGAGDVRP